MSAGVDDAGSVSLEELVRDAHDAADGKTATWGTANFKVLLALFIIFVVVVSSAFTGSVLAGFGEKAVMGRAPTAWGTILQGIFVVVFYMLAVYLIENRYL